jgi:hypothetical protein
MEQGRLDRTEDQATRYGQELEGPITARLHANESNRPLSSHLHIALNS